MLLGNSKRLFIDRRLGLKIIKNLNDCLPEDNEVFGNKYDIVCFLYSVILTKGAATIIDERQGLLTLYLDPAEGLGI